MLDFDPSAGCIAEDDLDVLPLGLLCALLPFSCALS
jgi:hypothetical protein